jgi:glutamyl-tRNA synthetase
VAAPVRTRFGPSLKTPLTVGALRVVLFNWALAKRAGGAFVVRVEDVDARRSDARLEDELYESLAWMGVDHDEGPDRGGAFGPYRQSERLPGYRRAADALVAGGRSYRCFCSGERLAALRAGQVRAGHRPRYDARCAALDPGEAARRAGAGEPHVVRMRVPLDEPPRVVDDPLHGPVTIPMDALDDQVLLKSDGFPTYHLASVVDDHAMAVSHVLRTSVWIPSTPKHLLLHEWLGSEPPVFVHVAPVPGGGATVPVRELRAEGLPPEAVVDLAARLGWRHGLDRVGLDDLRDRFSVDRLRTACGAADLARARAVAASVIRSQPDHVVAEAAVPFLARAGLAVPPVATVRSAVRVARPHLRTYADLAGRFRYLFEAPAGAAGRADRRVVEAVAAVDPFDAPSIEAALRRVVSGPVTLREVRRAICGAVSGPDLFLSMEHLGRSECLARLAPGA